MKHNENKVMRSIWLAFSVLTGLVVLAVFSYEMWERFAFQSQAKEYIAEESVSYEEYIIAGEGEELSTEQKINDFLFLSKMLTESTFLSEGNEELLGILWEERNAAFLKMVEETKSDVEFYFVLQRYLCGLKSVHTYIVNPSYERYISYTTVRAAQNLETEVSEEKVTAFEEKLSKAAAETMSFQERVFIYIEGKYYESGKKNAIVRVNGNEDVQGMLNTLGPYYKMEYDFLRERMYYPFVILNEEYGKSVMIEMSDGEEICLYYAPEIEYRVLTNNLGKNGKIQCDFMYLCEDNTAYLRIGSLAWNRTDELVSVMRWLEREEEAENLIIDLRGNVGGTADNVLFGVLDKVFPTEIRTRREYYIPYTEWNRNLMERTDGINENKTKLSKSVPEEIEDGKYYYHMTEDRSVGSRKNKKYTVYVLVNSETASAADWLAHYLREYMNAVIVGQNTGGEGLSESPVYTLLPNSGLLVSYFDSYAKNSEGKSNSVYGTVPDYYVENTIEDMLASENREKEKSMKALMEHDTQLRYVFEKLIWHERK